LLAAGAVQSTTIEASWPPLVPEASGTTLASSLQPGLVTLCV
jgi:hypothetical protein